MADEDQIAPEDISFSQTDPVSDLFNENMTMKDYELRIVKLYLKNNDHDIKKVAQLLDIGQSTIYRMLKKEDDQSK